MANISKLVPEGFVVKREGSKFAYQNAKHWSAINMTGRMVQGVLLGRTEPDKYGKRGYIIKAAVEGMSIDKEGNNLPFPVGTQVTLNSCGSLDSQLEDADAGDEVIIDFDGAGKMSSGNFKGSKAYTFTVYHKPGNGLVTETAPTTNEAAVTAPTDLKAKLAASLKK